ncbi:MAG: extracellular solute-binding protein [Lachnospiraceae bacterium]|nr:extracellular solute-binding protein [Lachnospiraceae bacterium]
MRKQLYSIFFVLLMLVAVWGFGLYRLTEQPARETSVDEELQAVTEENKTPVSLGKTTLRLWYTDEGMEDYLQRQAQKYNAQHEDIRLLPIKVAQTNYLEHIYEASVEGEDCPDLYLTTNDTLEKAYLSGIASETGREDEIRASFPEVAQNAVTYHGRTVAFPLYYETALFFYNKTYLEQMAKMHNEALQDTLEAEAAMAETEAMLEAGLDPEEQAAAQESETPEAEEVTADDLVPGSFEDILNLANDYDAPEGMEGILKWDVTDVFYNYFFAGKYIQLGGEMGDDPSILDLQNPNSVACMEVYQALKPFFSIEAKDSDYDTILQEFIDGKILFTIATTDAIAKLDQAKADGSFQGEYGLCLLPDLSSALGSRGLSVTQVVAVNGFSDHADLAADAAAFLSMEAGEDMYNATSHYPANTAASGEDETAKTCFEAYEKSVSLPKIMEASNFWMQLEITMTGIWEGDEANEAMEKLQGQMSSQLAKKG